MNSNHVENWHYLIDVKYPHYPSCTLLMHIFLFFALPFLGGVEKGYAQVALLNITVASRFPSTCVHAECQSDQQHTRIHTMGLIRLEIGVKMIH